ncbi:MAG: toxin-antitoxin system YwqK family antitoxin [Bacteroidales bacterium]|nr:toxin-antitoxin system YwqK family antitoxin [Bacteroidales bacterium]
MYNYLSILFYCVTISINCFTQEYNKKDSLGNNHGWWIIYDGNVKIEEGNFVHGNKEGVWKGYYPNGNIKYEITYKNGKAKGYAKFYFENGNISEEGYWDENKWVGEYKLYHSNGNIAYEWNYNQEGKRTGIQKYYHENGKLMMVGEWKDGKESGIIKEYDKNGSLISEKVFNDGKLDEASIKIYDHSKTEDKKDESKNKENVPIQKQEEKQIPSSSSNIEYFTGTGFYKTYTKDGKIEREGEWKNGRLIDGKKYTYDENGKLIKTTIYKKGNVVNIIYNED